MLSFSEVSTELLAQYKKKAGEQASAADKAGNYKKADKRFSGIVKATKKQFANDVKKHPLKVESFIDFTLSEATKPDYPPTPSLNKYFKKIGGKGSAKDYIDKHGIEAAATHRHELHAERNAINKSHGYKWHQTHDQIIRGIDSGIKHTSTQKKDEDVTYMDDKGHSAKIKKEAVTTAQET